jgi:hypothetical protein
MPAEMFFKLFARAFLMCRALFGFTRRNLRSAAALEIGMQDQADRSGFLVRSFLGEEALLQFAPRSRSMPAQDREELCRAKEIQPDQE